MHAFLALIIALATPALAGPRDRLGYERDIETKYNQPKVFEYVLNDEYLAAQKNRAKLVTRFNPDEAVAADNVILESNVVRIVRPAREVASEGEQLVRQRRGYNLENVRVPARYPYLPWTNYNRFRRWG